MISPGLGSNKVWRLVLCILVFYVNNVACAMGFYPWEVGMTLMILDILVVVGMIVSSVRHR